MFNQRNNDNSLRRPVGLDLSTFMSRVYAWMTAGIAVTGVVAYWIGNNPELVSKVFTNALFFWAVVIVQLLAVVFLTVAIRKISAPAAAITFLAYSGLTGVTLSMIFVIYTQQSIAGVFATTAFAFAGLSVFGYTTKRDLGPIGSFCMMGLFGMIAVMFISFFIPSMMTNSMQLTISVIGVLVFAGLTAYDTQRIKAMTTDPDFRMNQLAIYGALILYLDFINLFLNLLRLMGDRK